MDRRRGREDEGGTCTPSRSLRLDGADATEHGIDLLSTRFCPPRAFLTQFSIVARPRSDSQRRRLRCCRAPFISPRALTLVQELSLSLSLRVVCKVGSLAGNSLPVARGSVRLSRARRRSVVEDLERYFFNFFSFSTREKPSALASSPSSSCSKRTRRHSLRGLASSTLSSPRVGKAFPRVLRLSGRSSTSAFPSLGALLSFFFLRFLRLKKS